MSISTISLHDLLIRYQKLNQQRLREIGLLASDGHASAQVVFPPEESHSRGVPTLKKGFFQPMTAMLNDRFNYAGCWKMADSGHDWLSLSQMENAVNDDSVRKRYEELLEFWEDCPLVGIPHERISIFGMHPLQGEEIYLLWPSTDFVEPAILSYTGNFETRHVNFRGYLETLVEGAKEPIETK